MFNNTPKKKLGIFSKYHFHSLPLSLCLSLSRLEIIFEMCALVELIFESNFLQLDEICH